VDDDEESGIGRSPVAKQVFPDTAGSATRRTIASTLGHSTFYVSVTEFSAVWAYTPKLAGLKNSGSLYRAVQTGRLKTVTTAAGPRTVRRTTRAWLREYLEGQRRET